MTVWYESTDSSAVDAFRLITSGANGIIAADRALLRACLNSSLFSENSLLRPIGIIGHRGMPSQASENTLAGSALGATYGANIIDNDIYITKDGVLVVMHDGTVDRTTNGTGKVEDFTYTVQNLKCGWSPVYCCQDGAEATVQLCQMGAQAITPEALDSLSQLHHPHCGFL